MEDKHLEENQLYSPQHIDVIFEQVAVGMMFTGKSGVIKRVNNKFAHMLGYEPEELKGLPVRALTYIKDQGLEAEILECEKVVFVKDYSLEKRFVHKDGSIVWTQVLISGVYDKDGELTEFFGTITDISKTKEVETIIRNQTLLFATAMDSIPANVFIKGADGSYLACNSKYALEQNTSINNMIGKKDTDFFEEEIASKYRNDDVRIMKTGVPEELVEEYIANNKRYWISTIKAPVKDNGEVIGIVGMFTDITEKKKSDEEIAAHRDILLQEVQEKHTEANHAKEMMQMFFDTSIDLMCIFDKEGMIKNINPSWMIDLGWKDIEIYNRSFIEFIHPDDLEDGLVVLQAIKNENRIIDYELRMKCSDGSYKWFSWNLRLATNFIVGSARNVTAQRETEAFLLESKDAADKANKAKSEFIANMSHEIRTPLNAVIGFSELLALKLENTKYLSYVDSINLAGQSLLSLINDILDLSKIEADMMTLVEEKVNIRRLIEEIVMIFDKEVKDKDLKVKVNIKPDVPECLKFDHIRMRQVLLNIVGNAIKFTENGSVEVLVEHFDYNKNKEMTSLLISVKDSGIGISREDCELIFDSFRQQKNQNLRKYGGSGLGLSISKKLVEMMDGHISVESELGHGSNFQIYLNHVKIMKTPEKVIAKEEHLLSCYEEARILAVDDEDLNLLLLNELLKDRGLIVDTASTSEEAIKLINSNNYDLVIMDLVMPNVDGRKTSELIKNMIGKETLPIICFSANITTDLIENVEDDIFDDYLSKPVSLRKLINLLNKYLTVKNSSEIRL